MTLVPQRTTRHRVLKWFLITLGIITLGIVALVIFVVIQLGRRCEVGAHQRTESH